MSRLPMGERGGRGVENKKEIERKGEKNLQPNHTPTMTRPMRLNRPHGADCEYLGDQVHLQRAKLLIPSNCARSENGNKHGQHHVNRGNPRVSRLQPCAIEVLFSRPYRVVDFFRIATKMRLGTYFPHADGANRDKPSYGEKKCATRSHCCVVSQRDVKVVFADGVSRAALRCHFATSGRRSWR